MCSGSDAEIETLCPFAALLLLQLLQIARIDAIRKTGNSIGGVVECVARNIPVSWAAFDTFVL